MASNEALVSHDKVEENRDFVEVFTDISNDLNASEGAKRRRVNHDYRKLSKSGYDASIKKTPQAWAPCPLLPGVPAVAPPKKLQSWEVPLRDETMDHDEAVAAEQTSEQTSYPVPMEMTVETDDGDVIEDTPKPSKPPKKRERRPSVAAPLKSVWTDIELIGFSPQPSTSKTVPELGGISYEIDTDIEHDLAELNETGSEIEFEYNEENHLWRTREDEFYYLDDPTFAEDLREIDAEKDVFLRAIADTGDSDVLHFDWSEDINNFEGVREVFTGPSGPTFDVTGLTPLEVFQKIWDTDIIDHIVSETNRYAHQMQVKLASKTQSRMTRWKDTTRDEIWRILTIFMLQSLVVYNVERDYWYPSIEELKIGLFGKIMPYNRFMLLKRCLHFVDNTLLPEKPSKLDKVMPIIKHLNKKFSTLYLPEQNVAIDESLLLWKGRLSFAQSIATKRARVGIKTYELCEPRTGYLWKMEVYSGKGHVHVAQEQEAIDGHDVANEPESATSQIVFDLMKPLFGKGHTLVMDNFYNAPLLSRLLKLKHTDSMGTLRLIREFVPESLKTKNKMNMKTSEVCFSTTKDLSVVVWKDKNIVPMISTFHPLEVVGKEKYGYYKYKPKVVLDYNLSMGGVDHKNQMLRAYPIERVRNITWYKKLFRRLINVSVHNAMVIYDHDRTQITELRNREFRNQLVRDMMLMYSPQALSSNAPLCPPPTMSQMHLPVKNPKMQRCKLCAMAKKRHSTSWRCGTCGVNLCIEGCYTTYHAQYVCKEGGP